MMLGYIIFFTYVLVSLYFLLLFLLEFFTHLNSKIHGYTPPEIPMYYRHCPPPPPEYYWRLEYLESLPLENEVNNPQRRNAPLKN
jgi:hypothetical protein